MGCRNVSLLSVWEYHNPLVWLNQVKNKNRKLLRWSLTLQEYDIELEHKIGEKHVNVDALSRLP